MRYKGDNPSLVAGQVYSFSLLISVLLTAFLFFIDEGYYDLRWTKSAKNWMIFFFFVSGFFIGQAILDNYCIKKLTGKRRKGVVLALGLPLGFLLTYVLLYGWAFIRGIMRFVSHV